MRNLTASRSTRLNTSVQREVAATYSGRLTSLLYDDTQMIIMQVDEGQKCGYAEDVHQILEESAKALRPMTTTWLGGEIDYQSAWDEQRRLHRRVCEGGTQQTLLLEHASVFTAGSRTEPHELPVDGTEVVWVDRGGKITWHGPGQAVAYPIVALPDAVRVVDWVRRLEEAILRALAEWGIRASRIENRAGVWLDDAAGPRKIAQIGVRVSQRVSMHGVAINVSCGMQGFGQIIPCGITDAAVTTMQAELAARGEPVPQVREVAGAFARHLQQLLDFEPFETCDQQATDGQPFGQGEEQR